MKDKVRKDKVRKDKDTILAEEAGKTKVINDEKASVKRAEDAAHLATARLSRLNMGVINTMCELIDFTTFTVFPNLPSEIRLIMRAEAVEARSMGVEPDTLLDDGERVDYCARIHGLKMALLEVCQKSREMVMVSP